ncbi:MAG: GMC oxidoreductase [Acetobacteraceae bacterium]
MRGGRLQLIDRRGATRGVGFSSSSRGEAKRGTLFSRPAFGPVIAEELKPGPAVATDDELLADVRARASSVFHPVGTCRTAPDLASGVVDRHLLVHGVEGLRVIDASVFPTLTSGNTNAPVIMVAEKAADLILGG